MFNDIKKLIKNELKYFIEGFRFELSKNKGECIRIVSNIRNS